MVLNYLWFGFFLLSAISVLVQMIIFGNTDIINQLVQQLFAMAELGVEISIGLIGILALWMGFFQIAEQAGLINRLAKLLSPLLVKLMPEVPQNHPAMGSVMMNLSANALGLDNAATPLGIRAMEDLQQLNPQKSIASNAQILFLVLNTSSVTLLPITVFMYRAQQGATDPTAVFIPILIATAMSTLSGLLAVAWVQRINLFNKTVLLALSGLILLMVMLSVYFVRLPTAMANHQSSVLGNTVIFSFIIYILIAGMRQRLSIYDVFIEGAKKGFSMGVRLIPYLVAMLVAIGVLRASQLIELFLGVATFLMNNVGLNAEFVPALTTAFMKPLSGSGARAMMIETMQVYGPDSFPAFVASTVQGSTETTFYVLAVYFGAVKIRAVRHAVGCGLLADFVGIFTAIIASYYFYG